MNFALFISSWNQNSMPIDAFESHHHSIVTFYKKGMRKNVLQNYNFRLSVDISKKIMDIYGPWGYLWTLRIFFDIVDIFWILQKEYLLPVLSTLRFQNMDNIVEMTTMLSTFSSMLAPNAWIIYYITACGLLDYLIGIHKLHFVWVI